MRPSRIALPGVVAILVLVGLVVLEPVRVSSSSMHPTLEAGDHVLVVKVTPRLRAPARRDVVVLHAPGDATLSVKRVVAVGGDTVALEDGALVVDGIPVPEPEVDASGVDSVYFGPVTVPLGTVFVLGDDRGVSVDSRRFGPVPIGDVVGVVVVRLWPWRR